MELSAALAAFILTALLGLSFLCALAEASLLSLGRWQVQSLAAGGGKASRAARWLEHPEDLVSTLSLANTLANGLFVVTSLVLARQFEWSMAWVLVAAFAAVLAGGEILPKALAVRAPERWAVWTVPAVDLLGWVTLPVRRIAQWAIEKVLGWLVPTSLKNAPITDEEYRELLDMAVQQGALGHSEREIIAELITLDRKCARDVMRPRATMAAVPDDLSVEDLAKEVRRLRHRRLPMYDETPDTIVGVLNARLFLLDPEHGLDEAIEFPSFVPETMNLLKLFQALQRQNRSLAIVLDEYGAVAGVVRMEDILGEVLGDMTGDPATRGFVFEKLGPGRWRVSGSMRLDDFRREHPALPPITEVETLGGLLTAQLDIIPAVGQSAVVHGLRLTADQADERHVHVLVVEVAESPMNQGLTIAVAVIALGVAFLLSGMEAGVFALSRFRIRRMARQGDHRAARLQRYLDRPENFLWTIVVGNTLATLAVVSLVAHHLDRWLSGRVGFAPVVVGVLLVFYVFGDLLPKILFRRFPNRLCLLGVGPFRLLYRLLSPFVGIAEWIARQLLRWTGGRGFTGRLFGSRAELRQVIEASSQALSSEEVVMINRILDLQNLRVRDVMTPMTKAATLESSAVVSDLCRLGRERSISYVPLWKGSGAKRRVLGVAPLSSVLYDAAVKPTALVETLVQPALFVDEGMRLEDALRMMQRSRQRLAVVLNPQRRETGVLTLNDILRAMFGEVRV